MFYGETVADTRALFRESWRKFNQNQPLEPLEQQLVAVICDHPEYHALLEINEANAQHEPQFFPELGETNPFLHMGLHLLIREQVSLNRPSGITAIYQKLCTTHASKCDAEHHMMQALGEILWQAQRDQTPPDETRYLQTCQALLHKDEPF